MLSVRERGEQPFSHPHRLTNKAIKRTQHAETNCKLKRAFRWYFADLRAGTMTPMK